MATDNVVTKWSLDASEFRRGIRKIQASMANIQAGMQMATGALSAFGNAMGEVLTRGAKFSRLQDANTLSIEAARKATKGLVSDMELLKAANSAVAFDLGLNEKQFAKLTQAAVIMSQKLGTDANQAIGDLTLGLARQSRKILDNLGIMVSVSKANEEYAAAVGKSAKALTDAEQKTAFMNATMKELDRLTQGAAISAKNAGDRFEQLKIQLDNAINSLSTAIIKTDAFKDLMEGMATTINDVATVVKLLAGNIDILDKNVTSSIRRLSVWMDILRGGGGKGVRGIADAVAEFRNTVDQRFITGRFVGERTRRRGAAGGAAATAGRGGRGRGGFSLADFVSGGERGRGLNEIDQDMGFIPFVDPTGEAKATGDPLEGRGAALADAMAALNQESLTAIDLETKKAMAYNASTIAMNQQKIEAGQMTIAIGALNNVYAGTLDAAAAALAGTESFGIGMLKALKSLTLGLSKQLLAQGINAAISAKASASIPIVGPALAAQWSTSAGIFFAGAATMAGLGLGLSAATAGTGGSSSATSSARGATSAPSPVLANRSSRKPQPINVNVFLGDPGDPSAAKIAAMTVAQQINQQAA
jgi:hypothetical protein